MTKTLVLLGIILLSVLYVIMLDFDSAYADKTGSYNFCVQFPAFPECVGWRTEALFDNFWFCDYVYLENFCKNPPPLEKQISLRSENYCCRYIGPELEKSHNANIDQYLAADRIDSLKTTPVSLSPALIWTDRDHYDFSDKVIIYGKFDFNNIPIKQNIQEINFAQTGEISGNNTGIDIQLEGRKILRNIPVNPNGWFSVFFFLNDRYHFSTQNNLLEVEYYLSSGDTPLGGPKTHATYHFTTGDISKKEDSFELWLDDTLLPDKIRYGIITENPERFNELNRNNLVIARLITPNGYVIPIPSNFSMQGLSAEYDGFREYGQGTYEIQITYGSNTSKTSFTY